MIEFLFSQYKDYSNVFIFLELTAVVFGIISVLFARKNNILVYPTGLVSTLIYVYILLELKLFGDFIINIYYSVMSILGWYLWTRKKNGATEFPISVMNRKDYLISSIIFAGTLLFVALVYFFFDKFTHWTAYVDTLTTALFFVGMWLMAKRKIENWLLWIVADIISVPLYFYKGLTFSSIQFLLFTIIAILGYIEWRKFLQKQI
ncbi:MULTISPECIES: nicotinamide riboside transporter PnuC [unclassified Flavobacterium]|uniref:nicotinamide riboside transporter PnuC n=1 Tax=unclassified Flavobacterium TaxID=196869 RepID=UPI001290FA35|nr:MULTISPECIES: nicotinamide riboside transporter PnuC [unclassified Flavobacterium]MQP51221.1 nicotinamide riboside transporter PnuC [Flavobacterium sp. LMO9]MQP61550.1 nicotinamide riboside transporter PnuC [Flavobacterium sp. LMO6]